MAEPPSPWNLRQEGDQCTSLCLWTQEDLQQRATEHGSVAESVVTGWGSLNAARGVSTCHNERCLVTAEFTCWFAGFLLTVTDWQHVYWLCALRRRGSGLTPGLFRFSHSVHLFAWNQVWQQRWVKYDKWLNYAETLFKRHFKAEEWWAFTLRRDIAAVIFYF